MGEARIKRRGTQFGIGGVGLIASLIGVENGGATWVDWFHYAAAAFVAVAPFIAEKVGDIFTARGFAKTGSAVPVITNAVVEDIREQLKEQASAQVDEALGAKGFGKAGP